jgi:DNA-binding NarL/FixJ family response regulator
MAAGALHVCSMNFEMKLNHHQLKDASNGLTKRQAEILQLLRGGQTDKQMAGDLGISEETVAHHLRVMYRRHDVPCRAVLVAKLNPRNES